VTVRLYETSRQQVVPFEPGPVVTMYTCGITPYDAAHIGHAAVYVTYDVLQRRLVDLGHRSSASATSPTSTTRSSPRRVSSVSTTSTSPPPSSRAATTT
jgi:hypothetical protein